MERQKKPSLRYFARFRGDYGHLHAVVRHGVTRKTLTTPLIISADQLPRLDSSGHLNDPCSDADWLLEARLRTFTSYVWLTVNPLLDNGGLDAMTGKELTAAIMTTKKAEEERREKELEAYADARFRSRVEEAERQGKTLNQLAQEDFVRLQDELQKQLTPEEYAALWEPKPYEIERAKENHRKLMKNRKQTGTGEGATDEKE